MTIALTSEAVAILDAAVVAAVIERAAHHGVELEAIVGPAETNADLACTIHFGGERVHGTFRSTATDAFVRALWPADLAPATGPADLADWFGELVNHLFGALCVRLASRGCAVYQGAPTVVRCVDVERPVVAGAAPREHLFRAIRGDVGQLRVLFDIVLRAPLDLTENVPSGQARASTGHDRLF